MKIPTCWPAFAVALLLSLSACGKKADVKAQVSELERTFQAVAASGPVPTGQPASNPSLRTDAQALVNLALSAVQSNDYAGGVIALQAVQRIPGVTANQLMAAQRVVEAMTADLVTRADRGDAKAKAELAAIEKTRSQ